MIMPRTASQVLGELLLPRSIMFANLFLKETYFWEYAPLSIKQARYLLRTSSLALVFLSLLGTVIPLLYSILAERIRCWDIALRYVFNTVTCGSNGLA